MASNVKFGIQIDADVQGKESVEQLTARLDEMAKVLEGELKQEAQAAAAKLRELGQQQAAIAGVEQLKREVQSASAALKQAEKEASDFAQQIGQAGPPTAQAAAHLQRLESAAEQARASLQAQRTAQAGAVAELQKHGIAASQTQAAQARLNTELAEARARAEALAPAWAGTARAAGAAGEQMQRTHRAVGEGVQSISTQLQRVQSAYLALSGGGVLGGMIKDAVQTADAFSSLGARIKLVTGDGTAFQQAMEGVQRVAMATRSDLEATGTLFTKLATAGKELGLSQNQALALTQTINQAIQITGGSADAAKAAITQLTQGLQSGTLRGDEFNSVMEQAPRLAQALAAGLGVGTGELRAMAEQGRLTSSTVIAALRGQSEAVAAEFAKLPPTVSGALQNVSTAWSAFVGDLNRGTGATQKLAEGLKFLADHLNEIAGAAITLGQGALAVGLLRLTQGFLTWAGNARLATVATAGLVAETTKLAGAMAAAESAKVGAVQKAGLLATAWGGVVNAGRGLLGLIGGPLGLVALTATYAKDLGELAAKLALKAQGLRNLEEIEARRMAQEREAAEAAEREKEARDRQIEADKAAALAKFGLSKAAQGLLLDFDELIKKGKTTDAALGDIGKSFDLSKHLGVRDAAGVLDRLRVQGLASAEQVQEAWAKALAGQNLADFERMARSAFGGVERGVAQMQQALDAGLREAIRRTGLDFGQISGGMSKAATLALADVEAMVRGLDRLKAQGVDTGLALSAGLSRAIQTADSERALEAVRQRIESLRKELGTQVTDGLLEQAAKQAEKLKSKMDEAKPGINSVTEAMKLLGVRSQESLSSAADEAKRAFEFIRDSGTAAPVDVQEAFRAYAEKAIAANAGVVSEALKVEAAMYRVNLAGRRAGDGIVSGMNRGRVAVLQASNAMAEALSRVGALTDAMGNVTRNADGTRPGGASGITPGSWDDYGYDENNRNAEQRANLAKQGGPVDASYNFDVRSRLERGEKFTADEIPALLNAYRVAVSNQALGQPGSVTLEGRRDDAAWVEVFRRALEQAQSGALGGRVGGRQAGAEQGPVYQTVVNLGSGRSFTVNTSSPQDQDALAKLLEQLAADKGRSGP
ncbi:tape measure domain-containing protein [Inhella inkyongensis]|uniref:Tape measure domain-containing protein n=1 Tax=Inhella inkyongensis TaxID=392593 RepID=A0A840S750_9BURK|nr:tape measure protein [Inhella inkyongensis]MBB5204401.1 tape measure domain-containing protein [Inhella inkyongensis]